MIFNNLRKSALNLRKSARNFVFQLYGHSMKEMRSMKSKTHKKTSKANITFEVFVKMGAA
jgi:hypothetical protein